MILGDRLQNSFRKAIVMPILSSVLTQVGFLLYVWNVVDRGQDMMMGDNSNYGDQFDFIVVGSGAAGAVVANRLSQFYSVLLLEAGGEPFPLQMVPGFTFYALNHPEVDWMHRTVPQKRSCLNSVNQQSSWSAGKGLGGTSSLNGMIHLRGHPKDYDNWYNITGDPSWSYEGVLPYFKRSEDFVGESTDVAAHGFGGDLRVEVPHFTGLASEWNQAGVELGYPHVDVNGRFKEGFDAVYLPIKKGRRQATFKAFIQPIRSRQSLTIRKFSHATKIIFRDDDNIAYGVEYDRHGRARKSFAIKEVIISAGAITTPKLLMLSGIGPRQHLEQLGIPVRLDLPVGQNLMDHISTTLGPFFINSPRTIVPARDVTPQAALQWLLTGKGIFTTTCQATAIVSSSYAKARGQGDWPDIHLLLAGFSVSSSFAKELSHTMGLNVDEMKKYYEHAVDRESFHVVVSGARPFSRGEIKLSGPNPYDPLIIDPKYLEDSNDVDIKVIIEGIKIAMKLAEGTAPFQKLETKFTTQSLPGCEHLLFRSDQYWECYIRRNSITLHHPTGTAAMGSQDSPNAVVDTELRVLRTKRLRVIDASIQPVLVVTNTQASTIMIGEKGADMILRHWAYQQNKL